MVTDASPEPREPLYYTVKRHLLEYIESLEPGSAVPPERVLEAQLGISRTTVRVALSDLVTEGRLVRRQGLGTFVAEPKIIWPLHLTSFTAQAVSRGMVASTELIGTKRIRADDNLATHLGVDIGAPVYRIERLRLADNRPMVVETSHLSAARFPQLINHVRREPSLYEVLDRVYGVVPVKAEESISAAPAPPREAALLSTDTGAPMFHVARHSFDASEQPVEWVTSWCRGDRLILVATLTALRP